MTVLRQPDKPVRFFGSLRRQLIQWFVFLGLVPLAVVGTIAYISARQELSRQIIYELNAIVDIKAQQANALLTRWSNIAATLAVFPDIMGDTAVDGKTGLADIQRFKDDRKSREVYREAYRSASNVIVPMISAFEGGKGAILIGTNGEVLLSTLPNIYAEGSDVSAQPYFVQGMRGSYISDVLTELDGSRDLIFAHQVVNGRGETVGVIAIQVEMSPFDSLMGIYTGLGETGETYLVDLDTGLMITVSRFSTAVMQQKVDAHSVQQARAGVKQGSDAYDSYNQTPVLGSWQVIEDTNWLLVGEVNRSEADLSANQLALKVLGIAAAAGLVIAAVAYFIARSISRPLNQMTAVAVEVASGQLDQRVTISSRNELGVLSSAFNQMADSLQTMMAAERESKAYLEATVAAYSGFVRQIASGDLTARLPVSNNGSENKETADDLRELGLYLNLMVENLAGMALQIRETAAGVSATAAEILAAANQQIASAAEQEAAVVQTMATVEQVRSTVRQTAEHAHMVAEASRDSVIVSRGGQNSVIDTVEGMKLIRQRVEDIAENILMLSERTQQIGEIINTVNDIADQSKLLALNASIEAARAGEEGKGFAVVALEVRQLAEQSREATARVRDILNQIQQATNTAVMVTEEGSKGAESGMALVERAGAAITELAATIENAAQSASQIAASAYQQTNGMDQLVLAMASIKQATAQTAASTRQAERSAQELNDMARHMEHVVASYQLQ